MAVPSDARASKMERNRYAALAFCWGDLLFELDQAGTVQFCAGPIQEFCGVAVEQVVGQPVFDLVAPSDVPALARFLKSVRSRGRVDGEIIQIRRSASALLPVSIAGYCMDERFYVAFRLRIGRTEPEVAGSQRGAFLERDAFSRAASQRIKELERQGRHAEITVLDIAGLSELSDEMNEVESRALLSSIGECLGQSSLNGESITRIAGDSFGLLHESSLDIAALRNQLTESVRPLIPPDQTLEISHSTAEMDTARSISEQDLAKGLMYALSSFQKKSGDDFSLSSLTDNISSLISQGITDIRDFRKVLQDKSFLMALQPIIDVKSGEIHHFEALCRFDVMAPEESPYRYISFAEEIGLIHEFDLAMVVKVVQWLRKMPVNNRKFSVAVNISGFSIGMPDYVQGLHKLLRENPWTVDRLLFEITESSRMTDLVAANEFIQGLRRLGYHVCLDDFGAGAASFQYLSALEVDVVKIDGSAVHNARKAPKGRAFLSALTELCGRLGVETIAEMIDSPDSLRFVRDCRCNYVQGFLFGKPSRNYNDFTPLPNADLFRRG